MRPRHSHLPPNSRPSQLLIALADLPSLHLNRLLEVVMMPLARLEALTSQPPQQHRLHHPEEVQEVWC